MRRKFALGVLWLAMFAMLGAIACMPWPAQAQAAKQPVVQQVRVPDVSPLWRIQLERESARYFGLQVQPARMAAQIHQESHWRATAKSPYAMGLTQFTPATAKWLPSVCPDVGPPDLWNPTWSISAHACYMAWLYNRVPAFRYAGVMTPCSRWAFAQRAYNGGEGWLQRERLVAQRASADANDWHAVEAHRARAEWAWKENIDYPRRILLRIEPAYLAAGWPGGPACA